MDPSEKQAAKYKSKSLMGYIQDKVDVGMTKLRSDDGVDLDVAVLKATLQDECPPKEKHVRTLKTGCSGSAPRQQVSYVIHGLAKRLEEKSGWLVTLKTLIVFHRLMREVDASFQEEIIRYQERTGSHRLLRLDAFADHTTKDTWDYSAWIRVYSVYLDERLGAFKNMKFDPELESAGVADRGLDVQVTGVSGTREGAVRLVSCGAAELLEKLPQVQRLLGRLIACVPEGAAQFNEVVLMSCAMVLREVRSVYKSVCEGVINLADKFFEMERPEALRGLELYKDNIALNEKLNTFFSAISHVPPLKGVVQLPSLQSLPADFLTTMEDYVKDAPRTMDAAAVASSRPPPVAVQPPQAHSSTAPGAVAPGSQPPAATRMTNVARAGGLTSSAITGGGDGYPPAIQAPMQGVLKIGPPTGSAAPQQPAPVVDLLGDDFSSAVAISPTPAPQTIAHPPAAAAAPAFSSPPQQPQYQSAFAPPYQQQASGMAPAFPPAQQHLQQPPAYLPAQAAQTGHSYGTASLPQGPPAGAPPPALAPSNPFAAAPAHPAAAPGAPQGQAGGSAWGDASAFSAGPAAAQPPAGAYPYGQQTFPAAGFSDAPAFGGLPAPAAAPFNPFAAAPAPAAYGVAPGANPFLQAQPAAGPPSGSHNPFLSGVQAARGPGTAQGAPAWGVAGPAAAQARKTADPLHDLGVDMLFGRAAAPAAPVPSLRDLKQQPAM